VNINAKGANNIRHYRRCNKKIAKALLPFYVLIIHRCYSGFINVSEPRRDRISIELRVNSKT